MKHALMTARQGAFALAVAMLGLVIVASPASAHQPVVTGSAVCNQATGQYDVTWTISSDADYDKDWQLTSVSRDIGLATPTALQDDQSPFIGHESAAPGAGDLVLQVDAHWQSKTDPSKGVVDNTRSGSVHVPDDPCGYPADAAASVDVQPPTCEGSSTATFSMTNATSNPAAPDQSPGAHVVVFTADQGHTFSGGGTTLQLDYTIEPKLEGCEEVIPATPEVSMHDECGTKNDTGPTYVAENQYWTAATVGNTVVFTAKPGFLFTQQVATARKVDGSVSDDGTTWTVSFTPNTDKDCPEVKGEQETKHHHSTPEVKGVQATAPAAVPTTVEAGLAGSEQPAGGTGGNPLALLAIGAGLGLIGLAGTRRRPGVRR